jgi:predicted ester cyclase
MTQQNKNLELAQIAYNRMDGSEFERAAELVSPRVRTCFGGKPLDLATWMAVGRMFMTAFPNGRHVFEMQEAAGDWVVANGYFTGTHSAEFQGIPATGKTIKCSFTMVDKWIDGKIVEHYGDFDSAALIQQLTMQ